MNETNSATTCARLPDASNRAILRRPYAYLAPNNLDPRQRKTARVNAPTAVASRRPRAHSAALGLQFYDKTFPEKYRNGAFVLRGVLEPRSVPKLCVFLRYQLPASY